MVTVGEVRLAETAEDIARCLPVMAHLRPHVITEEFVERVEAQQAQGYRLAYMEDGGSVVAVAGFRVMEMLASGRTLYVDDLVTDESRRSRGHGKALMDWLQAHARSAGCETFSLDSGTHRQEAHAFYFRERMRVTSFHFAKKLE
jgi:GNAT superfamily N-acetyltransferase